MVFLPGTICRHPDSGHGTGAKVATRSFQANRTMHDAFSAEGELADFAPERLDFVGAGLAESLGDRER